MSDTYPNNMFLKGIWEPLAFECDVNDVVVLGTMHDLSRTHWILSLEDAKMKTESGYDYNLSRYL